MSDDWRSDWRNEPRSPWRRALGGLIFGLLCIVLYVAFVGLGEWLAR